ncbi:MAG: SCP2 sterol-binding domain-containing protein [Muribaculaceae bacterium]|nr:SCP2 sterol-binding domain-containing protein [Roseburia sp.]MCM1429968.1 SCP2 sterol-binding domain-containing protein [Muribaculaceae bacterium]MCM1493005.1 SCP2 sterol-binding domain-containing protein [Muribaculaceae bacterium]
MTYAEIFASLKGKFMEADVSSIQEHLAYQFNIEGEGGGIFYVEAKDGVLSVEPYEYYDRDAMFTATAEVFEKIAEGKLDPVFAFTTQKLKVEGDIQKALRLKDLIDSRKKSRKSADGQSE